MKIYRLTGRKKGNCKFIGALEVGRAIGDRREDLSLSQRKASFGGAIKRALAVWVRPRLLLCRQGQKNIEGGKIYVCTGGGKSRLKVGSGVYLALSWWRGNDDRSLGGDGGEGAGCKN